MAGGYKNFGPTYKSTDYLKLGYEGLINGTHGFDPALVAAKDEELTGRFCTITADGVKVAADGGADAVGLFREELGDMVNASLKASFYFRGGEYYVHESRVAAGAAASLVAGDKITCDAEGKIRKATAGERELGVVTYVGTYKAGNMYEWAGTGFDADTYVGFIMSI